MYRYLKNLYKSKAWKNVHELHGIQMPIDRSIMSMGVRRAIAKGNFEGREATAVKKSVRDGDVVLELGAGIGLVSTLVAKNAQTKRIVTVEANPQLIPFIRKVHELNQAKVEIINGIATGTLEETDGKFYLAKDFCASSMTPPLDGKYEAVVEVPFAPFKKLIDSISPDVIIVDIEGAEINLFGQNNLNGVRTIIMEIHQSMTGMEANNRLLRSLMNEGFMLNFELSENQVLVLARSEDSNARA